MMYHAACVAKFGIFNTVLTFTPPSPPQTKNNHLTHNQVLLLIQQLCLTFPQIFYLKIFLLYTVLNLRSLGVMM